MKSRASVIAASLLVATLLPALAVAQTKVPGEKWRQTMSMEMAGMSMPARTTEMCTPIGKGAESAGVPQDSNCTTTDVQNSGNKMTAHLKCTGKDAMEGTLETIKDGDHVRGTMKMTSKNGDMTMKFDTTKLPGACEAIDYSSFKPPVVKAAPGYDIESTCKKYAGEASTDASKIVAATNVFVGGGAVCGKSPSLKTFCSAVQSHAGFALLDADEKRMLTTAGELKVDPKDVNFHPLTNSLASCGLGNTPAAIDGLRKKLMTTAVAQNEWEFLLGEGDQPEFNAVVDIAKRECSGRASTGSSNPRYARMCGVYGQMLVRNDRRGVMSVFNGQCSGDCGSSDAASPGRRADGSSGANSSSQPGAAGQDPAKETAKDKAKDAVDKGKKLLRGILGGG